MPGYVNFLAIVFVYFLLVYLTAIRRGGQSFLAWFFLILLQAASLYYHEYIYEYVQKLPFLMHQPQIVCRVITICVLVVVNILVIVLINLFTANREKESMPQGFTVNYEDIPPISTMKQEPVFHGEGLQTERSPSATAEKANQVPADFDVNVDDERIFKTISQLIDDGNQEAAVKYLRMVVYFGKNELLINKAKKMLDSLQRRSEDI